MYYIWMWEELNCQERDELVQEIVKNGNTLDAQVCLTSPFVNLTNEQRELLEPLALVQVMIKMQRQVRRYEQQL